MQQYNPIHRSRGPALLFAGLILPLSFGSVGATVSERCINTANDQRYVQIEALMTHELAKSSDSSLTVGIVEHGCLAWVSNFGTMGRGRKNPPTDRSIYPIASVTKVITGIMLLQLVERGVVHLTDPVERYVPEFRGVRNPYPWAPPVTLIQLATMTSGVEAENWTDIPDRFPSDDGSPATWDQRLVEEIQKSAYHFEPGTRREYSNGGYAILGLALSRAAHRSYTEYVKAEILSPLGMRDTSFSIAPGAVSRFAYAPHRMPRLPSFAKHPLLPAGGLFTTLGDLVRLMRFQFGLGPQSVLSHKMLRESLRLVVPSDADLRYGDGIGFAAVRNPDSDFVALGHGGETWNYISSYEYDRTKQSGIVVLTSHRTNDYKPLVRKGLAILNPDSTGGTGLKLQEEH